MKKRGRTIMPSTWDQVEIIEKHFTGMVPLEKKHTKPEKAGVAWEIVL